MQQKKQTHSTSENQKQGLARRIAVTFIFFILLLCTFEAVAQNVLPRVSVATRSDGLGYVFRMHFESAPDSFKVFQPQANLIQVAVYKRGIDTEAIQLPDPGRVVTKYEVSAIPGGMGLNMHLSENQHFVARAYMDANIRHLLLGLTEVSKREIDILTDGMRVIDWETLRPRTASSGSAETAPQTDGNVAEIASAPTETVPLTDIPDTVTSTPAVITPAVQNNRVSSPQRLRTVVIDPGHGGRDPGAVGPRGTREKDLTLAVAKRVGGYINQYLPDVNVVYTRTNDTFVDLYERGRIANRNQGDLFISIHANGSTNRQASGAEVYFLGVAKTEEALEVMKRENSVIFLEDPITRTRELTEEELILYELTNIGYMSSSQRLAEMLDQQFATRAGRRVRGVKQAGFIVLFQASMPAVLIELGFISNPQEERYMASEHGQTILASAIFRAIRDYKELLEGN